MPPEICNPSCNEDQITTYPVVCDQRNATRMGGFERFIVLDCDATINDLTSAEEWAAIKELGKLVTSPPGFGTIVRPETTTQQLRACGPEEIIDEISAFEWSTPLFDNENYMDFDFENDMKNKYGSKTILWVGCDGLLYYRYNWTTGTNPGFSQFVPTVYRDSAPKELQKLHVDVKFNTYSKGIKGIAIDQDVLDAIFEESTTSGSGGGGVV